MNPDLQRFLESLTTASDIDKAFCALADVAPSQSAKAICRYAASRGFTFSINDADGWIAKFYESIADADLRARWDRCRFRQINNWAAFLMLEREMKIEVPEDRYIGNPWLIDSGDDPALGTTAGRWRRLIQRCRAFFVGAKQLDLARNKLALLDSRRRR